MFADFIIVILGIAIGTMSGLLPGVGTSVSLLVFAPLVMQLDVYHLFLFYMAILSTAQFTGTIPSVFLNYPGESNSMPAVIEGAKFRKRKLSSLAIGLCAVGSVFGSLIAVLLTVFMLPYVLEWFKIFLQDNFKIILFVIVFGAGMFAFNRKRYFLNFFLLLVGYALSQIGHDPWSGGYRYTFGIESLTYGIPFYPLIIGIMVAPILFKRIESDTTHSYLAEKNTTFIQVLALFIRNISSAVRGSIIGFISALAPGFGTLLSTNSSYAVEAKLQKNYPARKIISAETANNSGGFAMLLPFVLIGIPLSASEFVLYNYLIEAGWSPFQFDNLEKNAHFLMQSLVPWFVFVNIIALIIAWPLAKTIIKIVDKMKNYVNISVAIICSLVTIYLGLDNYQLIYYIICLLVISTIAIKFRKISLIPILFSYLLGNELEFIIVRYWTLWTH